MPNRKIYQRIYMIIASLFSILVVSFILLLLNECHLITVIQLKNILNKFEIDRFLSNVHIEVLYWGEKSNENCTILIPKGKIILSPQFELKLIDFFQKFTQNFFIGLKMKMKIALF